MSLVKWCEIHSLTLLLYDRALEISRVSI